MTTFDGKSYDAGQDGQRLQTLQDRVYAILVRGGWWTLPELSNATGGSQTGVAARVRDLRKPRWGGHQIERQRVAGGLWQYRMVKP